MSYKLPGEAHPPISREEVEAFIAALNYGMKVSHKPEFLIALAEGWLAKEAVEEHNRQFKQSIKDAELYGKGFGTVNVLGRYQRLDPVRITLNYHLNPHEQL